MWKRKVLKQKARFSVKINYWRMIAVCFLAAIPLLRFSTSMIRKLKYMRIPNQPSPAASLTLQS